MPRKKVDNRIKTLIENGVSLRQRTIFLIVGDRGRDQVVLLHHMLTKATIQSRPNVLWCYKKDLGFSTHRKKRMKQLKKRLKSGTTDIHNDDPFELFISSTSVRYCYYSETHRILGNTYGMLVLQDFEALTPNLLARTVETVEGGGVITILLQNMTSLKQLYTLAMDVHSRYRTEAHQDVVGRFNERFLLSLADTSCCLVIDDQLNVLPLSSHMVSVKPVPRQSKEDSLTSEAIELESLKKSLIDTPSVGSLVSCATTLDQAKAVLKCIEAISEKTLSSTIAMTASRGRGKSAALGLSLAGAVAFGYSNIFVTSPSPENLKTLFSFLLKGLDALEYQEHEDYDVIQSTNPDFNKAVVRVNIFRDHRQTVQYIHPGDCHKLEQAELVCIDEAAAIPLPLVKKLLGPYLIFLASTVNGYEGTGRSLSLKLLGQLREQSSSHPTGRVLREVSLSEPIRYSINDPVEKWLYDLLCLDAANISRIVSGCPTPNDCELYYVNRDTLFCYHKASERFLHHTMSLYVSSHYKNTPNDLQLLSDAPAHHMFALLPPVSIEQTTLPDILCVLQVCLEGEISKVSIMNSLSRGKRASGDLIPWTISQQFVDHDFPSLSGARVVRIATHPDVQGMGYGTRALQLLLDYYQGKFPSLTETISSKPVTTSSENNNEKDIVPRQNLPPLLSYLNERPPEQLDYVGVSYGLTAPLLKFWKKAGFVPVYLRQTPNELTGEYSCIMLKTLDTSSTELSWLPAYHRDFCNRFQSLLSYEFSEFSAYLALSMIQCTSKETHELSHKQLRTIFSQYDLKRLELYSRNMADHHLITDLVPKLASLYFSHLIHSNFNLSARQKSILIRVGLQHKNIETLVNEVECPVNQLMAFYNQMIRKFVQIFNKMQEYEVAIELPVTEGVSLVDTLQPLEKGLDVELNEAATEELTKYQAKYIQDMNLSQYAIVGKESDWQEALSSGKEMGIVSVASTKRKRVTEEKVSNEEKTRHSKKRKHKH